MRALTFHQPWASLVVVGIKPIENRTWAVPSTLPQWGRCSGCNNRVPPSSRIDESRQPIHRPGDQLHRRLPPNPPEACGPVKWDQGMFPFRIAIHAGKQDDPAATGAWEELARHRGVTSWLHGMATLVATLPRGALLGYVTVTGCHHASECQSFPNAETRIFIVDYCSRWAQPDAYHWTLADPVEFAEPIPMRGRQGLWNVPDDALAKVPA